MSKYQFMPLDPYGNNPDLSPFDLTEDKWNTALNIRFNNGSALKMGGEEIVFSPTESAEHLLFNGQHDDPQWYYMSDGGIFRTNFTTETNLDTAGNVSSGLNWDATLFNNIPVFNNTVNAPWTIILSGQVEGLPGFPSSTTCEAVRPYKSFLIALNTTTSGTNSENRVLWSDSSDADALPGSWDIGDPTTLAGDAYLTSSKGEIIDGLQLRDSFIIYKNHAIYAMRLITTQAVMKIEKVMINTGILAKNCVQEFNGIHFVVSDGDVILFDGQGSKSIADKAVRATIFGNMDNTNFANTYVTRYDRQDEMWLCYPTTGNVYPNRAAIWNWIDNTWTFRELNEAKHIQSGLSIGGNINYDAATFNYDDRDADIPYNPVSNNPTTDTLVGIYGGSELGNEINLDVNMDIPEQWVLVSGATVSGGLLTMPTNSFVFQQPIAVYDFGETYVVDVVYDTVVNGIRFEIEGSTNFIDMPVTGTYEIVCTTEDVDILTLKNLLGSTEIITSLSVRRKGQRALTVIDDVRDFPTRPMISTLERLSLDLGSSAMKIVRNVVPRITAATGTRLYIRLGTQNHPDDAIFWHPEKLFEVGINRESNQIAKGRFISVRFRTDDADTQYTLHSFKLDAALVGRY